MSISRAFLDNPNRRRRHGVSLVETLVAGAILGSVLTGLPVWLIGAMRSCALANAMGQSHVAVLALQETLSRDVQQAEQAVARIELDGQPFRTDPRGDSLVLRLAAVDAQGSHLAGVFDYAVWRAEPLAGSRALVRRLFTSRDATGRPLTVAPGSTRVPEMRPLLRGLAESREGAPLFVLDRPVVEVSREVAVQVSMAGEPMAGRRVSQRYAGRFHMRNR
jgi:hypothetical protein